MKIKNRLISLMLAGTIVSATMGLTGCSDTVLNPGSVFRKNFNTEVSLDAGAQITNVVSYKLILDGEKYYLELFGHYDEGCVSRGGRFTEYTYTNHKDYTVTYEISQDEYRKIAKFYDNTKTDIKYLNVDNLNILKDIVNKYDPISVDESTVDNAGSDIHRS